MVDRLLGLGGRVDHLVLCGLGRLLNVGRGLASEGRGVMLDRLGRLGRQCVLLLDGWRLVSVVGSDDREVGNEDEATAGRPAAPQLGEHRTSAGGRVHAVAT